MIFRLMLVGTFFLNIAQCYDVDSSEGNRLEVSPFDTIIFSDIADIINDFENNSSSFDTPTNSNSESEENIEYLLSKYKHYLDRAHKQRLDYFEKTKTKSKIPLFRHDRYTNVRPFDSRGKYDNFYYTNSYFGPTQYKLPQQSYNNPLDVIIPLRPKERYMTKLVTTTPLPVINNNGDIKSFNKDYEKEIIDLTPSINKTTYVPPKSLCYCKENPIPSDCSYKQCLVTIDKFSESQDTRKAESLDEKKSYVQNLISKDNFYNDANHSPDSRIKDTLENVNIRIKVDIQIPKQGSFDKAFNDQKTEYDVGNSRDITSMVNLPSFNFPIPIDVFGYKKKSKLSRHDAKPLHKITIRKKKKSRVSNSNKIHKNKVITFHNMKLEPLEYFPRNIVENYNTSSNHSNVIDNVQSNGTEIPLSGLNKSEYANEPRKDESIYLVVNVTNKVSNGTEIERKTDNNIESDYSKLPLNVTTTEKAIILRIRRNTENVLLNIQKDTTEINNLIELKNLNKTNNANEKKFLKKADKNLLGNLELLYWPSSEQNKSGSQLINITYRILENENKKSKLNMSKEMIIKNHTRAVEQAIFGKANWDDVDTVAPEFMSFVGKYIRGVLTFCSQSVCHSMKCADKTCVHRICAPEERLNNIGHCYGSNTSDSIASMESIMDLPSNIAFEIVDILQERMLGKLYGKMTLCITTKCITFAASKKKFAKSKCNTKELNYVGQCPITEVKLL